MSETATNRRVVLVGLDGMETALMDEVIARGEAPTFKRLRETGAWVGLDSGPDHDTGLSWEVAWSGRTCATNNRLSAVEFDPSTYCVLQQGATQIPFWQDIASPGTTIVFDAPYTSTVEADDVVMVTAWGAHDPGYPRASWPTGLLSEIDSRFGPHPACNNDYTIVWNDVERTKRMSQAFVDGAAKRVDVVEWLLARYPDWTLLVTVMSEPHGASEGFWHGMDSAHPLAGHPSAAHARDALYAMVRAQDAAVDRLLAATPDAIHVVVSTGGMGTNASDVASMVLLPELLYRNESGKKRLRWRRRLKPANALVAGQRWPAEIEDRHRHSALRVGFRTHFPATGRLISPILRKVRRVSQDDPAADGPKPELVAWGLFDAGIQVEDRRTPSEIGTHRTSISWHPATKYCDAWPNMTAFALPSFYDGRIRINLVGRERDGIVSLDCYADTCAKIERLLGECTDGAGQPFAASVERRSGDPMTRHDSDCDLLILWEKPVDTIIHPRLGRIGPVPFRRPGGHNGSKGFAVFDGSLSDVVGEVGTIRPLSDLAASMKTLLGQTLTAEEQRASFVRIEKTGPTVISGVAPLR